MNTTFRKTAKLLQKLPGVGPRQAARFVLALLDRNPAELAELGHAITHLKEQITLCEQCFNLSDQSSREQRSLCHICTDPKRDKKILVVVEKVTDLDALEKTGLYHGLYHVLGGALSPLDGNTLESLKFSELTRRVQALTKDNTPIELIAATNPNTSGETTLLYLKELFQSNPLVKLTRLARGLASGSHLEYADEITLKHALEHRT